MYSCEADPNDVKLRWFTTPTSLSVLRNDGDVIINGTFFYGNLTCGLVVVKGDKKADNYYNRPALLVKDNLAWIQEEPQPEHWVNTDWAIGGGPLVLKQGAIVDFPDLHYIAGGIRPGAKTQRTAVGLKQGKIVPMVIDLANAIDVAKYAKSLGCTECLMLDGGGSSTWYEEGKLKFPSKPRSVTTALVIKRSDKKQYSNLGKGINNIQLTENFNLREFQDKSTGEVRVDTELVTKLQELRNKVGKPVTINSGYRTPEHNKEVGGSANSQHLLGKAADIVVSGYTPEKIASLAEEVGFRGIGIYPTFAHVDTREQKTKWRG